VEWVVVVDVQGGSITIVALLYSPFDHGYELDFGWGLLYDELVRRYQIYED